MHNFDSGALVINCYYYNKNQYYMIDQYKYNIANKNLIFSWLCNASKNKWARIMEYSLIDLVTSFL